jgi:predicted metalloprotease
VLLALTGCAALFGAQPSPNTVVEQSPQTIEVTPSATPSAAPGAEPPSGEPLVDHQVIDQEIADAVSVVGQFWATHFAEYYGGTYYSPADFIPYTADDLPGCGGEPVEPDNAFYCIPDNTILWDQNLMDQLYTSGGDAVIYLVIAHEWGHEIQAQLPDAALWTAEELQADCFAGAALYGAAADGTFQWEEGDTAEITNGLTFLADETPWTDIDSHGDPLDRIDAFNDGRVGGTEGCLPVE